MMNPPTYADVDRRGLTLTRAPAVILFGLAGMLGLMIFVGTLASLASGRWGVLAADAIVGSSLAVAFWMGRLLWTGRPIPALPWVVGVSLAASLPLVAVQFIMMGQWFMALCVLPWAVPLLPIMLSLGPRRPAKPKVFDDLA